MLKGTKVITTDTSLHCPEQVLEICAIQIETKAFNLIMLSLYRAPENFIRRILDATLKYLKIQNLEFVICSEVNIEYPNKNNQKKQVNSLLLTYLLIYSVALKP
jgi:hypothetical protein